MNKQFFLEAGVCLAPTMTMKTLYIPNRGTGMDAGPSFEPTYQLRLLSEVETFIKTHKRLPEIAPAADMQTNGVSVEGLQKVE